MKKALETRPVLAPGQSISDAVLQIAKNHLKCHEEKKIFHTSLSTRQLPQNATCRDSHAALAGIASLSNMQNGRERLAL